ncbi:MAG: hypothetical protein GWP91_25490, partial [Rhodobacterales bacterium]|nr:hypothetical protein [Rhodobacterales bacterium]
MTAITLLLAIGTANAGDSLPERLANLATQPDVVLVPPVGEPSPKIGSFVVPYAAPEGGQADPKKVGTYDVEPSSCSEVLVFKAVTASEDRKELWVLNSGVGVNIGLPQFGLSAGVSNKSMAGMEYVVGRKLILDTGLEELEMCCLQHPDRCAGEYISEYWQGTGKIHRMTGSDSGIKASIKAIEKTGTIDYANTKGWSSASSWTEPMYFAYRTQSF